MRTKRTGALLGACFGFFLWLILAEPVSAAAVALTFDDGPSGAQTAELVEILRREDVPATFFLCGYRLEQYADSAALLGDPRFELGVHGYTHQNMGKMSGAELSDELEKTCLRIMETTGRAPTLLRPPGGLGGGCVSEEAARARYPIVLWTVDPEDWRAGSSRGAILRKTLAETKDGDIILLHDLHHATLEALPELIGTLRARGFSFCTVSELARTEGVSLEPGRSYTRIPPNSG